MTLAEPSATTTRVVENQTPPGVSLETLLSVLEDLAPTALAEDWDNVGLLWEGCRWDLPHARAERPVRRVLFVIDLSEQVLAEAIEHTADFIVAYHPPIFKGVQRLTLDTPQGRTLLRAAQSGIGIYSPHTALDAASGGVNDWLAESVGEGARKPLLPGGQDPRPVREPDTNQVEGPGRSVVLGTPTALDFLVQRIKRHLGLPYLGVAASPAHDAGQPIRTVAICAGAGGALFARAKPHDLYLTGEMRHHDVRELVARGSSVVLAGHTHTERGYLPRFCARVRERTGDAVECLLSRQDRDPVVVS